MHNSLFIRDILHRTNNDPMRRERRDPHRNVGRDPDAQPGAGEFLLDGPWRVACAAPTDAAGALVRDVEDFLERMGLRTASDAENRIVLALDGALPDRDCRLSFRAEEIRLTGGGVSGLWAAVAWMEWEMRIRRGPILPEGDFIRRAAWASQIHQGPWGANYSVPDFSPEYLGDDAFALYAHAGVNEMMIYGDLLCYIQSAIFPELNHPDYAKNIAMLRDAARRAARNGVRFSYVPVTAKLNAEHPVFRAHPAIKGAEIRQPDGRKTFHFLCTSHAEVLAFYEESFRNLFRAVPELAGLVLITYSESFYHCRMWDWRAVTPCPRCRALPVEQMLSGLMASVIRGVESAGSKAYVNMWVYSWRQGDRRPLFRAMPPKLGVFHHVEKDMTLQKPGYKKNIWDYSIDFIGPTEQAAQLADLAHETGRPLFIKTETTTGLETFQFPYIPAMQHLAGKWEVVRRLRPRGVHQSWLFYGMFGSRAEELGFWAAYRPEMPAAEFLRRMAVRDFGPDAADEVLAAWACVSRAVQHLPCLCLTTYYIGPSFLGPAHPLAPTKGDAAPEVFSACLFYLQEGEETFSVRQIEEARRSLVMAELPDSAQQIGVIPDDPASDGWDIVIREYSEAAREAGEACNHLRAAAARCRTPMDKRNLQEELLVTELFFRTNLACENVTRFLLARRKWEETGDALHRREMIRVAGIERENALAARPIYEAAPWLDLSERIDGKFSRCVDMIDEKVRWIDLMCKSSSCSSSSSSSNRCRL